MVLDTFKVLINVLPLMLFANEMLSKKLLVSSSRLHSEMICEIGKFFFELMASSSSPCSL